MNFSAQARKIKKFTLKKCLIFFQKKFFLYFEEWNFLTPKLKKFSRELSRPKITVFLMFREMELPGPKIKKIFIFQKTEPFSQKGTFRARKVKEFTNPKHLNKTFLYS